MTIDQSAQQANKPQLIAEKSKSFNSLVRIFYFCGAFGILAGAINLFGGFSSGFSGVQIADVIFNLAYGILFFVCASVLAKGKVLAIWICGGTILFSLIYSFIMGRGFNFIIAAIGAWFIWQLFTLKKHSELS